MKATMPIIATFIAAGISAAGYHLYSKSDGDRTAQSDEIVTRLIPIRATPIHWERNHRVKSKLVMRIERKFIFQGDSKGQDVPTRLLLNYKTLTVGDSIPTENPDNVVAFVWYSSAKNKSQNGSFMDQPFNANFEFFKETGKTVHKLRYLQYRVVDTDDYPFSELFLKDQAFHDFFIHCGLHKSPAVDVCTMGKVLQLPDQNRRDPVMNLYIQLDKSRKSDWPIIEKNVTGFVKSRIQKW